MPAAVINCQWRAVAGGRERFKHVELLISFRHLPVAFDVQVELQSGFVLDPS